jgi:hypothetical protein
MLAACAEAPPVSLKPVGDQGLQSFELADPSTAKQLSADPLSDVCALAAALPEDDVCSLICDPDALEATLLAAGAEPGRCDLLLCVLSEDTHAQVGVCL